MTFVWKITSPMYRPAHKNKPSFQQKGDTLTLFTAVFWNCGRVTPDITGRPLAPSLLLAAHTAPLPHTAHGWTTRQHSQDSGISTEPTTLTCDFHNMLCSLAMHSLFHWLPCSPPPYWREFLPRTSLRKDLIPIPMELSTNSLITFTVLQISQSIVVRSDNLQNTFPSRALSKCDLFKGGIFSFKSDTFFFCIPPFLLWIH